MKLYCKLKSSWNNTINIISEECTKEVLTEERSFHQLQNTKLNLMMTWGYIAF